MIEIQVCQQKLLLLSERALYWVEKEMLIVADIHLGKASTFQAAGIPVPEGAMDDDLKNLKALILKTQAKRCIVVGDLIHAKSGLTERVRQKISTWLSEIPCPLELVIGNHDRSLSKQLPDNWKLTLHHDHLLIDPFCFAHIPQEMESYYVWSGHIHPQFLLKSGNDQITLRCFHLTDSQGILPAFSQFVGGAYVRKTKKDQIFVIAEDQVVAI